MPETFDADTAQRATDFLKRKYLPIEPRTRMPAKAMFEHYDFDWAVIPDDLLASEGRALSLWRDGGWGELVALGKYETYHFSDELVGACVQMIKEWNPDPSPKWLTCVPSLHLKHGDAVQDFARRLAQALGLPFYVAIEKVRHNHQQKIMENSYQQAKNLDGVFQATFNKPCAPCILVDDIVDSRWTLTIASALLRKAGCKGVYPLALAVNTQKLY